MEITALTGCIMTIVIIMIANVLGGWTVLIELKFNAAGPAINESRVEVKRLELR